MTGRQPLAGKRAWILGGGSGFGAAAAEALAAAGAAVTVSGRRMEALERTVAAVRAAGGLAEAASLDAAVADQVDAAADRIGPVDILVYSAGTNVPRRTLDRLSAEDWTRIVDVNLNGALFCARAVLPAMRARGSGTIILISSWAGWQLVPIAGAAYSATKHALPALTETINVEEGRHGIRATCLMPGEADTEVLDTRPQPPSPEARARMLRASDIGAAVEHIASTPARVCYNQIVISPLTNNFYGTGS